MITDKCIFIIQKKTPSIDRMETLKCNLWCIAKKAEVANWSKYLISCHLRFYSISPILFMYLQLEFLYVSSCQVLHFNVSIDSASCGVTGKEVFLLVARTESPIHSYWLTLEHSNPQMNKNNKNNPHTSFNSSSDFI